MSVSEILELIKAGYSKDEIEQMGVAATPDPEQPKPEPAPDPAEDKKKPAAAEQEQGTPDQKDAEIEKLKAQVKQLQDEAALSAKQEKKTERPSAEKAIRDFIGSL